MHWSVERSTNRIHIAVPVRITGTNPEGLLFDCEAWTLNISKMGACIQVPEDVGLPHRFHIVSDDYQFHADAEVIVVWERTLPQRAVGVRIMPGTPVGSWNVR